MWHIIRRSPLYSAPGRLMAKPFGDPDTAVIETFQVYRHQRQAPCAGIPVGRWTPSWVALAVHRCWGGVPLIFTRCAALPATQRTQGDRVLKKQGDISDSPESCVLSVQHPFPGDVRSSSRGPCLNSACTRKADSWLAHTLMRIEPSHSSECTHTDGAQRASVTNHTTAAPL